MKILFLISGIVILLFATNVRAEDCSDREFSLPGLTPYQSQYVYRGERSNGCDCPALSDGSTVCPTECRTGGSIDVPG